MKEFLQRYTYLTKLAAVYPEAMQNEEAGFVLHFGSNGILANLGVDPDGCMRFVFSLQINREAIMANYKKEFGNTVEHILRLDIDFDVKQKKFVSNGSGERGREKTTAVFTPPHIVKAMIAGVVDRLDIVSWSDVLQCRMIDPCFGSAHFLIEYSRVLAEKALEMLPLEEIPIADFPTGRSQRIAVLQRHIFLNCAYGVDRGDSCLTVARYSTWLATAVKGYPPLCIDAQLKIGNSLFGDTTLPKPGSSQFRTLTSLAKNRESFRKQILKNRGSVAGNAAARFFSTEKKIKGEIDPVFRKSRLGTSVLTRPKLAESEHRPFFWLAEFPEVFLSGGFKVFITNPPYDQIKGSKDTASYQSKEHRAFRLAILTDLDIEVYSELFSRDPHFAPFQEGFKNLFEDFILLKNKILGDGGEYCLITPNSILAIESTTKLRRHLWDDEIRSVFEFPEKDASSKRVFRDRKVACSIIWASKRLRPENHSIEISVFEDANVSTPTSTGKLSFNDSVAIDPQNVPMVLRSEAQEHFVDLLSRFDTVRFEKKDIREGELNETNNESHMKPYGSPEEEVYGTNRIIPYFFNFWPKQDSVDYCNLSKAKITKAKLSDLHQNRVATNGIAGTNDSRVLCASKIPAGTLLNSNVQYILAETVERHFNQDYYVSILNTVVFDQILRIQKKTNHNTSYMLASLPIPAIDTGNSKKENLRTSKISESDRGSLVTKDLKGQLRISCGFYQWLTESSRLQAKIQLIMNATVFEFLSLMSTSAKLEIDQEHVLCRELATGAFNAIKWLPLVEGPASKGRKIQGVADGVLQTLKDLREFSEVLTSEMNTAFMSSLGVRPDIRQRVLATYNLPASGEIRSISELESAIDKIDQTVAESLQRWLPLIA